MIGFAVVAGLLILAYNLGGELERAHLRALSGREARLIRLIPMQTGKGEHVTRGQAVMVSASAVIASDYFKYYLERLRNHFGGRMSSYESLLDRARREAACRLREKALDLGAREIVHVHVHSSNLGGSGVEVMIYGTAIKS